MTNKAGPKGYTRKKPARSFKPKDDKYELGRNALGVVGGAIALGVMMNSTNKPDMIRTSPYRNRDAYQKSDWRGASSNPYGRGSPIPRKKTGFFSW